MKNNKKWFSIIVAMWLVLITTLLAFTILEFIIPFWRDIKWIENSTKAYYQANKWIEVWLYHFSSRTKSNSRSESSKPYAVNTYDYSFSTFSSGTTIPLSWKWNSNINNNWNSISITEPIQLLIWFWFISDSDVDELQIDFRVPDFDRDSLFLQTLDWTITPIISWQLLSDDDTLNSIPTDITNSIFSSNIINWWNITLNTLNGKRVSDWVNQTFWNFFIANSCSNASNNCILKFSIVNNIFSSWNSIPFLEWQLQAWTNILPLRYSTIESSWKSFWFTKSLDIRVPQETVSQAFDFTVFQ